MSNVEQKYTDEEKLKILKDFVNKITSNQVDDLQPKFVNLVDDSFWDLLVESNNEYYPFQMEAVFILHLDGIARIVLDSENNKELIDIAKDWGDGRFPQHKEEESTPIPKSLGPLPYLLLRL